MDAAQRLDDVFELARRLEVEVRAERLGGDSGGLCVLRGRRVLFVDLDADPLVRLDRCVEAMRSLPGIEGVYVPPALRELFDSAQE